MVRNLFFLLFLLTSISAVAQDVQVLSLQISAEKVCRNCAPERDHYKPRSEVDTRGLVDVIELNHRLDTIFYCDSYTKTELKRKGPKLKEVNHRKAIPFHAIQALHESMKQPEGISLDTLQRDFGQSAAGQWKAEASTIEAFGFSTNWLQQEARKKTFLKLNKAHLTPLTNEGLEAALKDQTFLKYLNTEALKNFNQIPFTYQQDFNEVKFALVTEQDTFYVVGSFLYPFRTPWRVYDAGGHFLHPLFNPRIGLLLHKLLPRDFTLRESLSPKAFLNCYLEWCIAEAENLNAELPILNIKSSGF